MANENSSTNNEQVIRLDDIFYIIMKHLKTIIGSMIIGLVVGVLVSFALFVKGIAQVEYHVTASIAVTSTDANGLYSANSTNPNAADIHLAEDITDAVIYVCKSDVTLNAAAEKLQLIGVTADDIRPHLSMSQYEGTQIIEMKLTWENEEEGKLILEAITDVVPDILIDTLKIGNVSVVNPPKVKSDAASFINIKVVAICTILGAFACAGFYLLKFFIHPTYLHSEDIKENYNLDILGKIPRDKEYFSNKINSSSNNSYSVVQENFSACAQVLLYRLKDVDNVCVYLTSAASQEGKSTVAANLAYALADLGFKTLLLDMDIRIPSLASKFIYDRDDKHTMNAVYRGEVEFNDAVISINSDLDILPTKLEDTRIRIDNKMIEIISTAKSNYDFVIMDTSPVGQVADSMKLNQVADCAIFVVRQDMVWVNTITDSLDRLKKSGVTLLGVIMNDTKGGSTDYYYSDYENHYVEAQPNKQKKNVKKHSEHVSVEEEILNKRKAKANISETNIEELAVAGDEAADDDISSNTVE